MNREIKFRFWNKLARRFQPPSKYAIDGECELVYYDYEEHRYSGPIDFSKTIVVPQQYIGRNDKNGKKIYEGDLVECDDGVGGRIYGEVVYDQDNGAFRLVFTDILQWTFYKVVNAEVIGNIFENPELLK